MKHRSFSVGVPPELNDDRVLELISPSLSLVAIADGVGGHFGGSVAADIALRILKDRFFGHSLLPFSESFSAIKNNISRAVEGDNELTDMATTLTACAVMNAKAVVGHVGDTRLYHLRGEGIVTRTDDQNEGAELVRQGILTAQK